MHAQTKPHSGTSHVERVRYHAVTTAAACLTASPAPPALRRQAVTAAGDQMSHRNRSEPIQSQKQNERKVINDCQRVRS